MHESLKFVAMKSTSEPTNKPAAAQPQPLPLYAKAATAITRGGVFAGSVPVAKLARLKASLCDDEGLLTTELHVARNRHGRPHLFGVLRGDLGLICQRCLRPFRWPLDVAVDLRLVESEAEENEALKESECWLIEDDKLPLQDIVEDEALLALPLAPRCGRPDCMATAE
jgi:uncharacterized protein